MAKENWHIKALFAGNCGISGRSIDDCYVDAKVDLYSGKPLFIGNTQIEEWARDLGMQYPSGDLHDENEILTRQNAVLLQALERWEQIFNVLGSVGINLGDDLTEYVSNIRPDLEAIRQEFSGDVPVDRPSTEDDRQTIESDSESGPVYSGDDGAEYEANSRGINLGLG